MEIIAFGQCALYFIGMFIGGVIASALTLLAVCIVVEQQEERAAKAKQAGRLAPIAGTAIMQAEANMLTDEEISYYGGISI